MTRLQMIVWGVATLLWLVFMGPRLLVLQHGDEATQRQALIVLIVFSVILLLLAGAAHHLLRQRPERRSQTRRAPGPAASRAELEDGDGTRATDLLGPGSAARRATRAAAERRRRNAG